MLISVMSQAVLAIAMKKKRTHRRVFSTLDEGGLSMSQYDGPSFYKQEGKKNQVTKQEVKRNEDWDFPYQKTVHRQKYVDKREEKPSIKEVALERASKLKSKRSSTPYAPKNLPKQDYFDKRFQSGQKDNGRLYQKIYRHLEKPKHHMLLFEHCLSEEEKQQINQEENRPTNKRTKKLNKLKPDMSQILKENQRSKELIRKKTEARLIEENEKKS